MPLIFLCYSRKDVGIVRKVGLIVWATGATTWHDEASIEPGAQWRASITGSIASCDRMIVFWCRHSQSSVEVQSEYIRAIEKSKPVVPVRLDRTPLSPKLGPYQAIDVRNLTWWSHEVARWERVSWVAGILMLVIGGVYAAL